MHLAWFLYANLNKMKTDDLPHILLDYIIALFLHFLSFTNITAFEYLEFLNICTHSTKHALIQLAPVAKSAPTAALQTTNHPYPIKIYKKPKYTQIQTTQLFLL